MKTMASFVQFQDVFDIQKQLKIQNLLKFLYNASIHKQTLPRLPWSIEFNNESSQSDT